ncbi:hypothetical protein V1511DRAFT_458318 [Dipodascopsis uninucleata]
MVSKLTFKNDKSTKKRKRDHRPTEKSDQEKSSQENGAKISNKEDDGEEQTWVSATSVDDLNGPCMIILNDSQRMCMASDASGKIFATQISSMEPTSVQQVFVIGRAVQSDQFTLKSYLGKYVSISKYGSCEATSEAIGPEERMEIEKKETGDGWMVRSVWDRYISIKNREVRCDSDDSRFQETFVIRVQARFRKRQTKAARDGEQSIRTSELERLVGASLTSEQIRTLKQAFKGMLWLISNI